MKVNITLTAETDQVGLDELSAAIRSFVDYSGTTDSRYSINITDGNVPPPAPIAPSWMMNQSAPAASLTVHGIPLIGPTSGRWPDHLVKRATEARRLVSVPTAVPA